MTALLHHDLMQVNRSPSDLDLEGGGFLYSLAGGRCGREGNGACHAGATSVGSGGPSRSARATSRC